jgi:diguanylate cyclase (GGDEF)-like protein
VNLILRIDLNIFSVVFALVLGVSLKSRRERPFLDYRLFMLMLCATVFELVTDTLMWALEGSPTAAGRAALMASSFLYYAGHPVAPMFFATYSIYQVTGDSRRLASWMPLIALPAALSGLLSLASVFTGWYFYVDSTGFYRHGPLFLLFAAFSYVYLAAAFVQVIVFWRSSDARTLVGLLIFPLLPTAASVLQIHYYGLVLIWPAFVVSLLVVYVNIQQRKLSSDYLTGAYNRRRLDEYLASRMRETRESKVPKLPGRARIGRAVPRSFAGFMADVDDFKAINDSCGHTAGDQALVETVRILRGSLRSEDFLARYAGDEFVAVLPLSTEKELAQVVERVRSRIAAFSPPGERYRLSLSIGSAVFDPELDANADAFIERLDELMYREKKARKEKRG